MQSNNRGNPSIYSQQYSLFSLAYVRDRFYSLSGVFLYACLSLSTGHRRGFPCPFRAGRLPLYPVVGRPPNSLFCSWQIKALKGGLHLIMPFSFFFFSKNRDALQRIREYRPKRIQASLGLRSNTTQTDIPTK